MTDLTAIDVLICPDELALGRAEAENTKIRENFQKGVALDPQHMPHMVMLQRYVRTACLDDVVAAAVRVIRSHDLSKLGLRAVKFGHLPVAALPGSGQVGMMSLRMYGAARRQTADYPCPTMRRHTVHSVQCDAWI
jgi:hypothetical protein